MPIVQVNARRELSEFYPPPYNFLGPTLRTQRKRGVGQASSLAQTGVSLATVGASTGASIAGASSAALIGGLTVGAAIPIFGTIAAMLVPILLKAFSGCGQTCTLSSDAANQIEQVLQQNVNAYFASPRTLADQQAALANFDTAWSQLEAILRSAIIRAGRPELYRRPAVGRLYLENLGMFTIDRNAPSLVMRRGGVW